MNRNVQENILTVVSDISNWLLIYEYWLDIIGY